MTPLALNPHPLLYEIHTLRLLREHRAASLSEIPLSFWKSLAERGFTHLWLMGLWRRSLPGREIALSHDGLKQAYARALPDWSAGDIEGSPYAVAGYEPDSRIGSRSEIRWLKKRLNQMGLRLIVDFVPNHTALDHPWTGDHPERFIASEESEPFGFRTPAGRGIAHGRDPYFDPWTDTAQLNVFDPGTRRGLTDILLSLVELSDGVRCDMAMLVLNRVFAETWKGKVASPPDTEFWGDAIRAVKERRPDFMFIAEAYWGLEGELVELGFDYAYDKGLYDRLRDSDPRGIREHLQGWGKILERGVHFVENHDERRVAEAFDPFRDRAAALLTLALPGACLFHEGQEDGRKRHVPVQMVRSPQEALDGGRRAFYDRVFPWLSRPPLRRGQWHWEELPCPDGAPDSGVFDFQWSGEHDRLHVMINFQPISKKVRINCGPCHAAQPNLVVLQGKMEATAWSGVGEIEFDPWAAGILQHPLR